MTAELMLIILAGFAVYTLISWFSWEVHVRVGYAYRCDKAAQFVFGTLWPFGLLTHVVCLLHAVWRRK